MLRRAWVTLLGWVLVLAGLAALVLPGPGLLLLLAGLVVLSQEYAWAQRRVEPVKSRAFGVAEAGVQTWARIAVSAFGAVSLIAVGVVWCWDPTVPRVWRFGPGLPFGGWATGLSIIASGLVALALLVYSMRRFRNVDTGVTR
ncbi:MAG: PGPGW domain-containing protein [Nocardioidaceae bacterium]